MNPFSWDGGIDNTGKADHRSYIDKQNSAKLVLQFSSGLQNNPVMEVSGPKANL